MKAWMIFGIAALTAGTLAASAKETKTDRGLDKSAPIAVYNKLMATYDANRDGALSATEKARMPAADKAKYEEIMTAYDANKDGKITGDELAALKKGAKDAGKAPEEDPNKDAKKDSASALDKVL